MCIILKLAGNLKIKIYGTIILPVVLYECETWPLTLREERTLRVFGNIVLRRIFGPVLCVNCIDVTNHLLFSFIY